MCVPTCVVDFLLRQQRMCELVSAAWSCGHVVGMSPSHSDHFIIFIKLLTSGATPPRPVPDSCVPRNEKLFVPNRWLADMLTVDIYYIWRAKWNVCATPCVWRGLATSEWETQPDVLQHTALWRCHLTCLSRDLSLPYSLFFLTPSSVTFLLQFSVFIFYFYLFPSFFFRLF